MKRFSSDPPLVDDSSDDDEPTVKPNPSECENHRDIFDVEGNYLKTACQYSHPKSYDEACINLGMNLFIINTRKVESQILSFATSIFGTGGGSTLWVNGKESIEGDWFTFDGKNNSPLMSGIKRIRDSKWNNHYSFHQDCLILRAWGNFEVAYTPCNLRMYSFCEYKKTGSIKRLEQTSTTTLASRTSSEMFSSDEFDSATYLYY